LEAIKAQELKLRRIRVRRYPKSTLAYGKHFVEAKNEAFIKKFYCSCPLLVNSFKR
jgi:hypothetical protein